MIKHTQTLKNHFVGLVLKGLTHLPWKTLIHLDHHHHYQNHHGFYQVSMEIPVCLFVTLKNLPSKKCPKWAITTVAIQRRNSPRGAVWNIFSKRSHKIHRPTPVLAYFFITAYRKHTPLQIFSSKLLEIFQNSYFQDHITSASELLNICCGLTRSVQCWIWYKTQLFDFQCNSNDWFLYEMKQWAEMGQ